MLLLSLNTGRPRIVLDGTRRYSTAYRKSQRDGPVMLHRDGLVGDHQSDRRHHGGPDQAVCVMPHEHYAPLAAWLGRDALGAPAFGENFTTTGLREPEVCIGDTFRIGGAVAAVTQPREPCGTMARHFGERGVIAHILETRRCGFYLRVIEEGRVRAGDPIELLARPHESFTIAAALVLMHNDSAAEGEVNAWLALPALAARWRARLLKKAAPA